MTLYTDRIWLASHNSFANREDGWLYFQQNLSIEKQFEYGVRCFLVDFHFSTIRSGCFSKKKKEIVLQHGKSNILNYLQNPNVNSYLNAKMFFKIIKKLLDRNSNDIITIYIEDYIGDEGYLILKKILKKLGLYKMCTTFINNRTINNMIESNERLVLITSHVSKLTSSNDSFMLNTSILNENHWDMDKYPNGGKIRYIGGEINMFNHFSKYSIELLVRAKKINNKDVIQKRLKEYISVFGKPNFIVLDYVEIGDGKKIISLLE